MSDDSIEFTKKDLLMILEAIDYRKASFEHDFRFNSVVKDLDDLAFRLSEVIESIENLEDDD